jgi:hypothetical protein
MYRAVNLEVDRSEAAFGVGADELTEMLCECGEGGCSATIELSRTEYEEAHRQRDRFVVALGHEDERIEHVIKRTPRYLIVDKFGDAERIAEAEERREERRQR